MRSINDGCAGTRSALCVSAQTLHHQTRTLDIGSGYALHRTQQRAAAPNELALGERPSFDTLESQNIMLRPAKDLQDLAIVPSDGAVDDAIGDVKDLYFDDEAWTIRYLVVDTGSWLSSRKVLVSPIAAGKPDWTAKLLPVSLTREQVKNAPDIDTDSPVTRQHETDYLDYYSYPSYLSLIHISEPTTPY